MPNHPPRQPRHCLTAKRCISLLDFRDLLSKDGEKLDIKINPDGTGQLHVPGLRIIEVKSFQHIKKVTQHVAHLHSEEAQTSSQKSTDSTQNAEPFGNSQKNMIRNKGYPC